MSARINRSISLINLSACQNTWQTSTAIEANLRELGF